jgi:carbonic anhydrase/acetyltransferase-like protein (isoleucine patch superfamily)
MKIPTSASRRWRCFPGLEPLEGRLVLSAVVHVNETHPNGFPPGYLAAIDAHRPVLPPGIDPAEASFIDPTVTIQGAAHVGIASQVYIAPFASLAAGRHTILVGQGSDLQDNVSVDATRGDVTIAPNVAVAHGATIIGPATVGTPGGAPAFVGFNAVVDGATVEGGAMVLGLARVAPGIVIHSGFKVLPGKFVQTQAQADNTSLGKVGLVDNDDRDFIQGVLDVNLQFASGFTVLAGQSPTFVHGISPNPFTPPFNPFPTLPVLAGKPTLAPHFRDRIIGEVQLQDSLPDLKLVLGHQDSIRADEGFPFLFGRLDHFADRVTFHAVQNTDISTGSNVSFGYHSLVHGGLDIPNPPPEHDVIGNNVTIGAFAVIYASNIGDGAVIGNKSYIEKSNVAPGTVIPPGTILIKNKNMGTVEW